MLNEPDARYKTMAGTGGEKGSPCDHGLSRMPLAEGNIEGRKKEYQVSSSRTRIYVTDRSEIYCHCERARDASPMQPQF